MEASSDFQVGVVINASNRLNAVVVACFDRAAVVANSRIEKDTTIAPVNCLATSRQLD